MKKEYKKFFELWKSRQIEFVISPSLQYVSGFARLLLSHGLYFEFYYAPDRDLYVVSRQNKMLDSFVYKLPKS